MREPDAQLIADSYVTERLVMAKRSSGKVVKLGENESGSRSDGEKIVIEKTDVKGSVKSIGNLVVFFSGIIVLIVISSYLLVTATLMNFTKIDDVAVWNLYGVVPDSKDADKRLITGSLDTEVKTNFINRAGYSLKSVSSPFVGEVVSDRFDSISSKKGHIYLNGNKSSYEGKVDTKKLDNEYLVKCVSGACEKDEYLIVHKNNIVGNVYGYISLEKGLEPVGDK